MKADSKDQFLASMLEAGERGRDLDLDVCLWPRSKLLQYLGPMWGTKKDNINLTIIDDSNKDLDSRLVWHGES